MHLGEKVNCEFLQYIGVGIGDYHNILYKLCFLTQDMGSDSTELRRGKIRLDKRKNFFHFLCGISRKSFSDQVSRVGKCL